MGLRIWIRINDLVEAQSMQQKERNLAFLEDMGIKKNKEILNALLHARLKMILDRMISKRMPRRRSSL